MFIGRLSDIIVLTFIIWGDNDNVCVCVSLENSLGYSNGISNHTLIAIKDCDSVLNIEKTFT